MYGSCRRECHIAGCQELRLFVYLNYAVTFENDIQLVLAFVDVSRMLLTGLERVQPRKEEIALGQCALAHFVLRKRCQAGRLFQKHIGHFINASGGSLFLLR